MYFSEKENKCLCIQSILLILYLKVANNVIQINTMINIRMHVWNVTINVLHVQVNKRIVLIVQAPIEIYLVYQIVYVLINILIMGKVIVKCVLKIVKYAIIKMIVKYVNIIWFLIELKRNVHVDHKNHISITHLNIVSHVQYLLTMIKFIYNAQVIF